MEAILSPCEFEIVERLALGESKKEVAFKTNRSLYTVETTTKNAYLKLGFSKLSDLVLWYCGQMFDISFQISERKRQVFATIILILIVVDLSINPTDFADSDVLDHDENRISNYSLKIKGFPEASG